MAKDGWYPAKGLVYSVDWIDPSRYDYGHYDVVYSYRVADEEYIGQFSDYTSADADCLHKGDTIDILYNPAKPKKSFYSAAGKRISRLVFVTIGVVVGIIVMLIAYFTGGLNSTSH